MAAGWERLAMDWEDHKVGLVAQVDCTQEPELCEEFEVEGYPTLIYGDPSAPEVYDGSREYAELAEFAKETLSEPMCSIYNDAACSSDDKKAIAEFAKMNLDQLNAALDTIEKKAEEVEDEYVRKVEEIQQQYEVIVEEFNQKIDAMRAESSYQFLRAAITKAEIEAEDEEL